MAAIVRVKRRRGEEPVESLLFSCKRRKESLDQIAPDVSGVLKFAGTVPVEDQNVSNYIREAIKKDKLQREYKTHSFNQETRAVRQRQKQKQQSQSNRYKVVASRRAALLDRLDLLEDRLGATANVPDKSDATPIAGTSEASNSAVCDKDKPESQKVFCLYDVEEETLRTGIDPDNNGPSTAATTTDYSSITCNDVPMIRERAPVDNGDHANSVNGDYVYDLYYTNSREIDFRALEEMLTVEAFGDEMVFADSRADEEEYLEVYDDEEDSNDENNWRNDYPDHDPFFIENQEAEYNYGDDDVGHHRYDTEDPLASYMAANLNIRDTEEEQRPDQSVYDVIAGPQRSYKSYYRAMMRNVEEDDDSDEDYDVR